ncbi:hypothetical protein N7490_001201 [Penicillium lividum]|nr:hypothetical protein N7490_001201 [Penicillium lividum]
MAIDDASSHAGSYPGNNASTNKPSAPPASPTIPPNFTGLKIKPELIARPDLFTLYFGFFGSSSWQRQAKQRIIDRLEGTWVLTGRNPTQEELDAFTLYATKGLYVGKIGIPASTAIGAAYLYRKSGSTARGVGLAGRLDAYRRIFLNHKPEFMTMLSRTAFKMLFIGTLGGIVSGMASAYINVGGVLSDKRLDKFREDSRASNEEDVRKRKVQLRIYVANNGTGFETLSEASEPDSGMGGFDEDQSQQQYSYDASSESPAKYESQPSQPQPASSSDFFGGSDDASPTAPEYRSTNPDGSPMSSWDRIRQQNASSKPQPPMRQPPQAWGQNPQAWGQPQNQPGLGSTPPSAHDRYENDRNREREQAQAEFDRMMEAERHTSEETSRRGWGS